MSKKSKQRRSASSQRPKTQSKNKPSLAVPIIVAVVVVAILAAAIVSVVGRQRAASSPSGGAVSTALPQATQPIPNPGVRRISVQETTDLLAQGGAVLVDVRSKASYDKAHAAGAISIPEEEMDSRLDDLPLDKLLVLYCT